jgi:hypothetical protein
MLTETRDDPLLTSLTALEAALLTPVVAGELENWVAAVQRAAHEMAPVLYRQLDSVHCEQFSVIARDGDHLLKRVEDLREEDTRIRENVEPFLSRIGSLDGRAERVGSDEARVRDHLQELIDQGVALIVQIRKQETSLQTWLSEALNRDTGVGD